MTSFPVQAGSVFATAIHSSTVTKPLPKSFGKVLHFLPSSILSGTSVVGLNDGDVLFNGVGNAVGEYEGNSVGLDECTFEGLSDGASTHLLLRLLQT